MTEEIRFEPAMKRLKNVVPRSRLVSLLRDRFEHRVTTVVAAAGYGKTTALGLAVESNRLDPLGRDVLISLTPLDADPVRLLGRILAALGLDAGIDESSSVRRLLDATWSAAPDEIVLIIDDVHLLNATPCTALLSQLLVELPANAHICARKPITDRRPAGAAPGAWPSHRDHSGRPRPRRRRARGPP